MSPPYVRSSMYLTILGCNGPYPEKGGACSGYLIESDSGSTRIVLDLGAGCLSELLKNVDDITDIDGVVLSHLHFDHMSDMGALGYMLDFKDIEALKLICPDTPCDNKKLIKGKFDIYPPKDTQIGEFKLEFIRVRHPVESYAVKIICDGATLVYTGDTNECAEISLFSCGADTLLADCGLSEGDWTHAKPHLSPKKCALLAKESGAKELILTHLSPRYDKEELLNDAFAVFPDAMLAEKGMRVRI